MLFVKCWKRSIVWGGPLWWSPCPPPSLQQCLCLCFVYLVLVSAFTIVVNDSLKFMLQIVHLPFRYTRMFVVFSEASALVGFFI